MDSEAVKVLQKRAELAEIELHALQSRLHQLKNGKVSASPSAESDEDPELEKLRTENAKLNYRLTILKRAVDNVNSTTTPTTTSNSNKSGMLNIKGKLEQLFEEALKKAFPDLPEAPSAVIPTVPKFGDYQFNGAMAIAQGLKAQGLKLSPRDVASKIVESFPKNDIVESLELAGPGFINIRLSNNLFNELLRQLIVRGVEPPQNIDKKRVVVDFSSPNIAKEMHVGHLRSTIIGESICRLLEFIGHDIVRLNHIGDWGTQFGMLLAHLEDRFPNFRDETPPIGDLQTFYKEAKKRFDEDAEFKKRAYACVVKLQAHEPGYIKGWQAICEVSRREFQKIYDRLGVKITERGESFYQDLMNRVVEDLEKKSMLELDEGRKIMFAPGCDIPLTVVKSDGGYTYDTSDMAALRHRIEEEKGDWLVYVTDAGQATHFQSVFACAERAGWLERKKVRVDHVGFGVVLGEDRKKFKSRSSETVRLVDLLDEGLRRSLDKLLEKERNKVLTPEELEAARNAVAYGCIKYADLSHNRNHEYVFSFDKMLEDKGNTAVYLLYAYTRIRSIGRTANVTAEQLKEYAEKNPIRLEHEKEMKLAKTLLRFPEIIMQTSGSLFLHPLCDFLYEVSTTFTEFYDVCFCVEKDRTTGEIIKINMDRMILCEATALIMAACFSLLGLQPVEKM